MSKQSPYQKYYSRPFWQGHANNRQDSRADLICTDSSHVLNDPLSDSSWSYDEPGWIREMTSFFKFFYDPNEGTVLGRTLPDLYLAGIFYFSFYGIISLIVAAFMAFFMYFVIMGDYPLRTGENSLLRGNPGLGVVPIPDYLTSLIRFKIGQKYTYRPHVDDLVAKTQWYEAHGAQVHSGGGSGTAEDCYLTGGMKDYADGRKVCNVLLDMGGRCNIFQEFGYDEGMPCILLTLNRIYGWLPDPADNFTGVGVRCRGVTPTDHEMMGPLCYYDDDTINKDESICKRNGGEFKHYYYPYLKQLNYQSPIVFVEFMNPLKNVVIMVECYAIAKNIQVDTRHQQGSVRFQLLVD